MKKRLIGLLLVALMLVPLLSSCGGVIEVLEVEAPIYTLYTIADATPEALREVELAINRILFYRIGVCVDIVAVTEDEYDELIANQYQVMEEYTAAKKSKSRTSSVAEEDGSKVVLTGERLIDMLEKGEDITPKNPRLDIFLVRGYDDYFRYATTGMLAALDEKLTSEAKLLRDYIHSTFFSAAKLNKKTYGVPVNNTIGEYEYIVFDAELLQKYGIDAPTMTGLQDLEEYLQLIKENEPDIIPLKTATDSSKHTFMFEDGFAAYVSATGTVSSSYEDTDLLNYYAMIARYNALGYFNNQDGDEDARFAVTFVKGDQTDLDTLSAQTGKEYEHNIYQMPVATNRNTIENIYCVSKFVISNELTDVMKLITELFTGSDMQNILTYGVYGIHYVFDDNDQVKRLNSDYIINPDYTGNKFITYTLSGENPNKWDSAKKQNLDSIASKLLGFDVIPTSLSYTDEDGKTVTIYEPAYVEIIQSIIDRYYPRIINGSIVELDIFTLKDEIAEAVYQEFKEQLEETYKNRIIADYSTLTRENITNGPKAAQLYKEASDELWRQLLERVKRELVAVLTTQFREQLGPGATNDEIQAAVAEALTDDYIWENRFIEYSEEEVEALINSMYENALIRAIDTEVTQYLASSAYQSKLNKEIGSAAFTEELDTNYAKNGPLIINQRVDTVIADMIHEISLEMVEEFNIEIESAIETFVDEYEELLGMSRDEILHKLGYFKEVKDDKDKITYETEFASFYDFVFAVKLQKQYYLVYPLPEVV